MQVQLLYRAVVQLLCSPADRAAVEASFAKTAAWGASVEALLTAQVGAGWWLHHWRNASLPQLHARRQCSTAVLLLLAGPAAGVQSARMAGAGAAQSRQSAESAVPVCAGRGAVAPGHRRPGGAAPAGGQPHGGVAGSRRLLLPLATHGALPMLTARSLLPAIR